MAGDVPYRQEESTADHGRVSAEPRREDDQAASRSPLRPGRWTAIHSLTRALIADWGIVSLCLENGDTANARRQMKVMGRTLVELAEVVGLSESVSDAISTFNDEKEPY